jgi:hypothetical protein
VTAWGLGNTLGPPDRLRLPTLRLAARRLEQRPRRRPPRAARRSNAQRAERRPRPRLDCHAIVRLRLSVYRIAQLWKRVPAPDQGLIIGPGPGHRGLDAGVPPAIATAVLEAWSNETDPGRLRALGATMRQAGLVVAANVIDQRALVLEAGGVRSSAEQARLRDRAGGALFFASI